MKKQPKKLRNPAFKTKVEKKLEMNLGAKTLRKRREMFRFFRA